MLQMIALPGGRAVAAAIALATVLGAGCASGGLSKIAPTSDKELPKDLKDKFEVKDEPVSAGAPNPSPPASPPPEAAAAAATETVKPVKRGRQKKKKASAVAKP